MHSNINKVYRKRSELTRNCKTDSLYSCKNEIDIALAKFILIQEFYNKWFTYYHINGTVILV